MDYPVGRCAQFNPPELILGGRCLLDEFGLLVLRLAEVLHHFGTKVMVDFDDLKLGLADL